MCIRDSGNTAEAFFKWVEAAALGFKPLRGARYRQAEHGKKGEVIAEREPGKDAVITPHLLAERAVNAFIRFKLTDFQLRFMHFHITKQNGIPLYFN